MNDNKPSYYSITPATVRYDKRLTAYARLLYGEFTALSDKEGYCWAGNEYFASLYEVNTETISRWIKSIERLGYIRVEYERRGFEITKRKIYIALDCVNNQSTIDAKINPSIDAIVKENITSSISTSNNNNTELDLQITNQKKEKSTPDYEQLFDVFYSAFPKHTEKKPARKRLIDILSKSKDSEAKFSEIMEGVKKYKKNCLDNKTELKYIKNPSSWLLNERWEDEYEEEKKVGTYNIL